VVVRTKVDAHASSSSASTAGAFPLPLLFPFRIGAAVGDAISISSGDKGDVLVLIIAFDEGRGSSAVGCDGPGVPVGVSTMLGNLETEGRAETGGEGSEANEPFADITSGLRISGPEMDGREGQPNKLLEDFCFVGELKDVAVGVPGRDMGCTLRGGGCCGVVLASGGTRPSPGPTPSADGLNPSTIVGWRERGGCLFDPFKDGAD
jgi:hypothetical protein